MKIDTSSYYPKSTLGDDEEDGIIEEHRPFMPGYHEPEKETPQPEPDEDADTGEPAREQDAPEHIPDVPDSYVERGISSIATFLSWALVPLMMPVYGIILAFNLSFLTFNPLRTKILFTAIVAAFNLLIPMAMIYLLKCFGLVKDIGLNNREERFIPYIITILCMAGTGVFLYFKMAPAWLVMFFAGGAVTGLVEMLINFKWKISAHAAGIAGIVALLIRIMHSDLPQPGILTWLIIAIGLSGAMGSARVWLGRHTVWQVIAGYAVGFCIVFFMTLIKF